MLLIKGTKPRISRSLQIWTLVAVITASLLTWFLMTRQGESLESAGWRAVSCIHEGDGDCLYALSDLMERDKIGYDKVAMKRFASEYLAPAFAGTTLVEKKEATPMPSRGWTLATRYFTGSTDGGIGVRVGKTPDGPKVPTLVAEAFLAAASAKYGDPKLSQPERKVTAALKAAQKDGPLLEAMGIKGIWRDSPDQFLTWEEFAEENEVRLARVIASRSKPPKVN
jgi:hypothetical protein